MLAARSVAFILIIEHIVAHLHGEAFDHDSRLGSLNNIFGNLQLHVRTT